VRNDMLGIGRLQTDPQVRRASSGQGSGRMTTEEGTELVELFHKFAGEHHVYGLLPDHQGFSGKVRLMDSTCFVLAIQEYKQRSQQHGERS
jgi:hypothetical protein